MAERRALQRIAAQVMLERSRKLAGVLESLAESELEMYALGAAGRAALELYAHHREIRAREAKRLEVGEAPVGQPRAGLYRQGAAVHLDRPRLLADLAEQVSVEEPSALRAGVNGDGPLHERNCLVAATEESQRLRVEAEVVGIVGLGCEQPLDERQHLGGPLLCVQHARQLVAGGGVARR